MYPRAKTFAKPKPKPKPKLISKSKYFENQKQLIDQCNNRQHQRINCDRPTSLQDTNGRGHALPARSECANIAEAALGQRLEAERARPVQSALRHIRNVLGAARPRGARCRQDKQTETGQFTVRRPRNSSQLRHSIRIRLVVCSTQIVCSEINRCPSIIIGAVRQSAEVSMKRCIENENFANLPSS